MLSHGVSAFLSEFQASYSAFLELGAAFSFFKNLAIGLLILFGKSQHGSRRSPNTPAAEACKDRSLVGFYLEQLVSLSPKPKDSSGTSLQGKAWF